VFIGRNIGVLPVLLRNFNRQRLFYLSRLWCVRRCFIASVFYRACAFNFPDAVGSPFYHSFFGELFSFQRTAVFCCLSFAHSAENSLSHLSTFIRVIFA
jgi:hypothetical protein